MLQEEENQKEQLPNRVIDLESQVTQLQQLPIENAETQAQTEAKAQAEAQRLASLVAVAEAERLNEERKKG